MTDYSWRAGSQADETAIVLKNCVGNACLLTQARLLGHMPQLTMDRNKHLRSYPAIHRQQFRPPGMARDMDMCLPVGSHEIGRAHVCTPVTNAHLVCSLLLEK